MPIVIKNPNPGQIEEFLMLEIQGDLENRYDDVKDISGNFVGDVLFNKFGHPVSFVSTGSFKILLINFPQLFFFYPS